MVSVPYGTISTPSVREEMLLIVKEEHLTSHCSVGTILHGVSAPLHLAKPNLTFTNCGVLVMSESKLRTKSMDFSVSVINLVKYLKGKHESIISNQIGRSGTSIGANIREAQYAHSKADFAAKLQIALKKANETGYWLELLFKTDYISEEEYRYLESACTSIRVMLISSINTIKENKK